MAPMSLLSHSEGSSVCPNSGTKPTHLWEVRPAQRPDNEPSKLPSRATNPLVRAAAILVTIGVCALAPTCVLAQAVYGSIFGTITDQSGAAVVVAKLTVTSVQKGTEFETTTNETRNYNLTHLIPDQYDLRPT